MKSHLLRHCVEIHPLEDPDKVKFNMRQISSHKTAFERQLSEAVLIEKYSGQYLMNSKLEYTRCSIPKMMMKLGNNDEKTDPLKEKEKSILEKMKLLYKGEKKRSTNDENYAKPKKRRKIMIKNNENNLTLLVMGGGLKDPQLTPFAIAQFFQ